MRQSKLLSLLRLLSHKECQNFEKYVHSPFFNNNKRITTLCDYIMPYMPYFSDEKLDKQVVAEIIFKKEGFDNLKFNNLTSDLLKLLHEFLAFNNFHHNKDLQQQLLIQELVKRNATSSVDRQVKKYKKSLKNQALRSGSYYLHEFELYDTVEHFYLRSGKKNPNENLQFKSDQLDLFYLINKLQVATEMASRNRLVKSEFNYKAFELYLKDISETLKIKDYPVIQLYNTALQLVNEETETHYQKLKHLLQEVSSLISNEEALNINIYLLNFCIRQVNMGQELYHEEIFEIYQSLLNQEAFFEKNLFSYSSFTNIVSVSLRLQKTEWTKAFIQNFSKKLRPEQRSSAVSYNLAALYYSLGQYRDALMQLQDVEFKKYLHHISSKYIQVKCYYSLNEEDAFFSLLEAFRKYNSRTKQVYTYHKQANSNMIRIVKRIFQLRNNMKYIQKKQFNEKYYTLHTTLTVLSPVANKRWLLDILEELKGK